MYCRARDTVAFVHLLIRNRSMSANKFSFVADIDPAPLTRSGPLYIENYEVFV